MICTPRGPASFDKIDLIYLARISLPPSLPPSFFSKTSNPPMGSSASKASRLAGTTATKRKYPQRVPPPPAAAPPQPTRGTLSSSPSSSTSSSSSSPAAAPTEHPNLQASASKTEGRIAHSLLPFPSPLTSDRKKTKKVAKKKI